MNTPEQKAKKNAYMGEWNKKNPDKVKANKQRSYQKNKNSNLFKEKRKEYRDTHKEEKKIQDKAYQLANKEKIALNKRKYYLKNREYLIKVNCERTAIKIKANPLHKLKALLRTQIIVNLAKRKYIKCLKTEELLGAKIDVVREHIESLFKSGMTWENHGTYGWHIDHKIPLASAKNKEEVYKLFHYTNLQPLWAKENLSKGARTI